MVDWQEAARELGYTVVQQDSFNRCNGRVWAVTNQQSRCHSFATRLEGDESDVFRVGELVELALDLERPITVIRAVKTGVGIEIVDGLVALDSIRSCIDNRARRLEQQHRRLANKIGLDDDVTAAVVERIREDRDWYLAEIESVKERVPNVCCKSHTPATPA